MDVAKKELGEVCSSLGIDNETKRLAFGLLANYGATTRDAQADSASTDANEFQRLELACVLYTAFKLRAKTAKPSLTGTILPILLPHLHVSIADFLKELPGQIKLLTPAIPAKYVEESERKIEVRELQTGLVHSFLLSKKAKDTFERFLKLPSSSPILKVMWLLFLVAKARLLQKYPDLVTAYNMLLCVADFMLAHVQNAMAVIDFNDLANFPVRTADGGPDTLASIVQVSGTSLLETRPLAKKLNHLYQELFSNALIQKADFSFPDGKDIESRIGFSGLLAGDNVNNVIQLLDKAYQRALEETVEIDERPFIQRDEMQQAAQTLSGSMTPPTINRCSLNTPGGTARLSAQTPLRMMRTPLRPPNHILRTPPPGQMGPGVFCVTPGPGIGTPISESMRLAGWLKTTLNNASDQPSEKLREIAASCGADVDAITTRAHFLSTVVFSASPSRGTLSTLPDIMQQRATEGVKLYYRILETLLKEEAVRLEAQKDRLFNLISNVDFHRCLMACAFEVIIASYGMASLTFPAVLERMQLQAFDLCTIVESFARHEPTLPKALQIHLFRVEEMIMESLAWEKGSSLYPKLMEACTPVQHLTLAQELSNITSLASPPPSQPQDGSAEDENSERMAVEKDSSGSAHQQEGQNGAEQGNAEGLADGHKEGSKRALDGDQEVSPPKLQKGVDAAKILPQHESSPEVQRDSNSPQIPSTAPESPPKTPQKSQGSQPQPLAERVPSTPLNISKKSAFSAFMSPQRAVDHVRGATVQLPMSFGDPALEGGVPRARKLVAEFLSKVIRLGLHRASELCDRLDLSPCNSKQILKEVYTMIQRIVWDHTHLMYNRHLDQIVLCSLYALCKVHTLNHISFRELASQYRKIPRTKNDTYRTVVVEQSEPDMMVTRTGDIIVFYNSVFIPLMKTLVLKIGTGQIDLCELPSNGSAAIRKPPQTPKPASEQVAMTPPTSRKGAIGASPLGGRIFVYKQSPKKPFLSPKTKIFYAGRMGESAHDYQSPSKDLRYINSKIAAHSQSPIAVPDQVAEKAGKLSQNHVSSEPSYSSARTSDEARSMSPGASAELPSGQAAGVFLGLSRLGSSHLPQNGHTYGHRTGGSGLDDLHNAAMLLGSQDITRSIDSPTDGNIRRSRRQMGYSPRT